MKKIIKFLKIVVVVGLFLTVKETVFAANINLTIRDGNIEIFKGTVPLQPSGTINLNDSNAHPHPINADSVLSAVNDADLSDPSWNISDLQYFDSFGSFLLNCITSGVGKDCNNWQYTVDNIYPGVGMDQKILSDGDSVYVYFGPHYKIILNSNSINTIDNLEVTAQDYDYQNNNWIPANGVTVGIIKPDSWPTVEVQTKTVDGNGKAIFSSIPPGSYNVGIQPDYFPTETLNVAPPTILPGGGAFITSVIMPAPSAPAIPTPALAPTPPAFDTKKVFDFIVSQQKSNGSFGDDLYTDWTILALAGGNYQNQILRLVKYLGESKMTGTLLTDYERRSMALMSLGLNPYNINGENYIEKIVSNFDGKQFGDAIEDNDDIFALIVLQNAGFIPEEKIMDDDMNFILAKQKEDGSWDESADMTGAGIEALAFFKQDEQVKKTFVKAREFLKQNQKDNGGWGNVSSTAWAMEGILALSEKPEDWIKNSNSPLDYLGNNQDTDGGIKNENIQNKIWQSAYVASALSGKTWNQIMQKFEKPAVPVAPIISETPKEQPVPEKEAPTTVAVKNTQVTKDNNSNNKKEKSVNLENKIASQNTATAISAIQNMETAKTEQPVKKNWFMKLLGSIFGF